MTRTVQLLRHDASFLLRLKSGQLIANQIWEFCDRYDYKLNHCNGLDDFWHLFCFLLIFSDRSTYLTIIPRAWMGLASQAGVFRGARFSSLPSNTCSIKNNIPFPLLYLRGKWPINSCAIKCWRAKRDFNVTLELPFSFFLSFAKAMQYMEYSKIWLNLTLPHWI